MDEVQDLLDRAREGDAEAFAQLFESLRVKVHAVACRLVGTHDAEDVVMETYLKAWQALPRFRGGAALSSWVFRIANNCAIDHLRHAARLPEVHISPDGAGRDGIDLLPDSRPHNPAAGLEAEELHREVGAALRRIPAIHRTVLTLRYSDDLSYAEIAAATDVSLGTVMSRLFHAKRKLRRALEEVRAANAAEKGREP